MTLTRRQRALVAVFVLGLISLVVDRVFLGPQSGPGPAAADSRDSHKVPLPQAKNAPGASAEVHSPNVAERLDRAWPDRKLNAGEARNPFSLTPLWLPSVGTGPAAEPDPAEAFAKAHPLVAVIVDGRQTYALVNDRILSPGEHIDGFTLVSVGSKSAVFERRGKRVVLELASR